MNSENPDFGLEEFENNLAFWVLGTYERSPFDLYNVEQWKSLLVNQCDAEDQASVGDDDAFGCSEDFRSRFFITSPVQFGGRENPIPCFTQLLGPPQASRFERVGSMPSSVS